MSKNSLFPASATQPEQSKPFSFGILVAEAAIATLVLSVFVSSSPKLFTTQPPAPRPMTAINPNKHQPQLFSVRVPSGVPMPLQVKEEELAN